MSSDLIKHQTLKEPEIIWEPTLSVIVTAPHSKMRVVETILSVFECPDPIGTEVILVVTNPSSGELEHLERECQREIKKGRLRILDLPDDKILVNLRNWGAEKARGKRITFISAGDRFYQDRLVTLAENLTGSSFIGSFERPAASPEDPLKFLLSGAKIIESSVVIERTLFWEAGGYPVGLLTSAESLWLKSIALLEERSEKERIHWTPDPRLEEAATHSTAISVPNAVQETTHRLRYMQARLSTLKHLPISRWMEVVRSVRSWKN